MATTTAHASKHIREPGARVEVELRYSQAPRAASESRRPSTNQSPAGQLLSQCLRATLGGAFQTEGLEGSREGGERGGWDRGVPLTRYCHPPAASDRKQARTGSWSERTGGRLRARRRFVVSLAAPPSASGTFQDGRGRARRPLRSRAPPVRYPCGSVQRLSSGRPSGLTQWLRPCERHRLGGGHFPEHKLLGWSA